MMTKVELFIKYATSKSDSVASVLQDETCFVQEGTGFGRSSIKPAVNLEKHKIHDK